MTELFLEALTYAADKHVAQRRKGCDVVPYINHPIKVVRILTHEGGETDIDLLTAAILHDVLEDTNATEEEMRRLFGDKVIDVVVEVTDDMTLTYDDRKRAQIRKAPSLSASAKKIKIADKMANIRDMVSLPVTWSTRRKRQYLEWSQRVVEGCRNVNPVLEKAFDTVCLEAAEIISNSPETDS